METLVSSGCMCRAVLVGAALSKSFVMWSSGDGAFLLLECAMICVAFGSVMMVSRFAGGSYGLIVAL